MTFVPVELEKNGKREIAETMAEETRLRFDGWLPTGTPVVVSTFDDRVRDLVEDDTSVTAEALRAASDARYAPVDLVNANLEGGTPFAPDFARMDEDRIRRGKGGVIGVNGKGVVALRFDHQLDNFLAKCKPVLTARRLPWGHGIVTRSVGNPTAPYEPTTATWADLKAAILQGGEVWAHSQTHSDGVAQWGGTSLHDEIVGSRADIEAQGLRVMGFQVPGSPATWGQQRTIEDMRGHAGKLMAANYGLFEFSQTGTEYRQLPTHGDRGLLHMTIDQRTLSAFQGFVDIAVEQKIGIEFMLHPIQLDQSGYVSTATWTQMMDYVVAKRDAGLIEVLTPSGLAFADPSTSYRPNLVPHGDFEDVATAAVANGWKVDTASWTINTDGGHSGNNYLHVPVGPITPTARVALGGRGMDGFTFQFEGWVRARDTGGSTWRVSVSSRGNSVVTLLNETAAIAQGTAWTRVLRVFSTPIDNIADLTIGIGRSAGGSVDWDDVSVRPI